MFNENQTRQMYQMASDAMDTAEKKITEVNAMKERSRAGATTRLLNWQSSLGVIAFTVAAISAAFVVGKPSASPLYLLSLVLLLATGMWILLMQKEQAEQVAISATKDYEEVVPLYADKKKAAFLLWREPNKPAKYVDFLEADAKILEYAITGLNGKIKVLSADKTYYRNDIWLASVFAGTYLLTYDPTNLIASNNRYENWILACYWLLLVIGMVWIAYRALSNKDTINDARDVKIKAMKSDLKHTKEYMDEVRNTINATKEQFSLS